MKDRTPPPDYGQTYNPKPVVFRGPWRTVVVLPPDRKVIDVDQDRAAAEATAIRRFEQERHVFVSAVDIVSSLMIDSRWSVLLSNVEQQDASH